MVFLVYNIFEDMCCSVELTSPRRDILFDDYVHGHTVFTSTLQQKVVSSIRKFISM